MMKVQHLTTGYRRVNREQWCRIESKVGVNVAGWKCSEEEKDNILCANNLLRSDVIKLLLRHVMPGRAVILFGRRRRRAPLCRSRLAV